MDTRFSHLVGCRLPFQLAVLGGVGTTELAAAVSAGGGLGMVPYGVEPPPTGLGPSGIGFLIPYLPPVEVVAEAATEPPVSIPYPHRMVVNPALTLHHAAAASGDELSVRRPSDAEDAGAMVA